MTCAANKDTAVVHVVPYFRRLVNNEMQTRWGDRDDGVDSEIELAASDYATLVFTDPAKDRGKSFEWAMEWL